MDARQGDGSEGVAWDTVMAYASAADGTNTCESFSLIDEMALLHAPTGDLDDPLW